MKRRTMLVLLLVCSWGAVWAAPRSSVAVIPFTSTSTDDRSTATSVTDLVYAELTAKGVPLVEREQLTNVMQEQGIAVISDEDESQAVKVGKLVAARFVIVGRVLTLGEDRVLVARLISVETTSMLALTSVADRKTGLTAAAKKLADDLADALAKRGEELAATKRKEADPVEELLPALAGKKLPRVVLDIAERSGTVSTIDPAVETEVLFALQECGFTVLDADQMRKQRGPNWKADPGPTAEVIIRGEGLLERSLRVGGMNSGRARVELKATDAKTGTILAVARGTASAMDVTPLIAAKTAAQKATRKLLKKFITRLVDRWNQK